MRDFIMNEKIRAERILDNEITGVVISDITILAKYFKAVGYKTAKIKTELERFVSDNFKNIPTKVGKNLIVSAMETARKYPLYEINQIAVTRSEMARIQSLSSTAVKNPRLHKMAFALLCFAKYFALRGSKDGWVCVNWSDIFAAANLRGLSTERKRIIVSSLISNNYIYVPPLSDKSCYKLLTPQDETDSDPEVIVDNVNESGMIFEEFEGKRFVKCQMCGCRVPVTNGRAKHCETCAVIVNRQRARERMRANSQRKREAAQTTA